jgi:hypothetical protein
MLEMRAKTHVDNNGNIRKYCPILIKTLILSNFNQNLNTVRLK